MLHVWLYLDSGRLQHGWFTWAAVGPSANIFQVVEFLTFGYIIRQMKLEFVAGPAIQANGRLTFEDDLRSGGLLCYTTQWTSVCTGLAYSHSGGTQGWLGVERYLFCLQDISGSAKWHQPAIGHLVSLCVKCCRMVDSVPRWWLSLTNWPI